MSDKKRLATTRMTNWEKRLELVRLKAQGLSNVQVAKNFGTSRQAVDTMWRSMKNMTVEEAEQLCIKNMQSLG